MHKCAKLNGNGNDFIAISNMGLSYSTEDLRHMALSLCRRKESIGGDGLLVAEPSARSDFKMRIFNSDGSEGEMCGNGARCLASFAYENKIAADPSMVFETLSGDVSARVGNGTAQLDLAPVNLHGVVTDAVAAVEDFEFAYTFLTVGVPHAVIFLERRGRNDDEFRRLGRAIRNRTDLFPDGSNVDFVFARDAADELFVLTYERGVEDLTLSCGTGSAAAAIAACLSGRSGSSVKVWNPGGLNSVSLDFAPGVALPKLEGAVIYVADIILRDGAIK